jgi:NAD(P)H-flavin reductase
VISAILFLWVVDTHIPAYAAYNVWFAVAALCFDHVYRVMMLLWQNVKIFPNKSNCVGGQRFGHRAVLTAIGDSITVVTVKDVHFKWAAGQHLYLWIPRIGMMETHPYTIACSHQIPGTCTCNSVQLIIRKHAGFSQRIHKFTEKARAAGETPAVTAFLAGPYGAPPRWDVYETLILISASTGASFTLPILESVLQTKNTNCTRRIDFLLTAKQGDEIEFYVDRLHKLTSKASEVGIQLLVHIAVTSRQSKHLSLPEDIPSTTKVQSRGTGAMSTALPSPTVSTSGSVVEKGGRVMDVEKLPMRSPVTAERSHARNANDDPYVHRATTRPDIAAFIRAPVEVTGGETSVVVCGGPSLVARVRNCVASLSDERAVHKGTGAQGIQLHVEEYCF